MRILSKELENILNGKYQKIIEYCENNNDVYLGIRNNALNLYVNGGSFFKLTKSRKGYKGYIEAKYFKEVSQNLKEINNKEITDISKWLDLFDNLKSTVKDYMEGKLPYNQSVKREKILQQKLIQEFNNNSLYYAYDIEYNLEEINNYVYDADGNILKNKKPATPGRADILLVSKPLNNKVTIYFMEVKEGIGAFSGVQVHNLTFGSGIVGHIKNYVPIINLANSKENYYSEYRHDRNQKSEFNIKEILLTELKEHMKLYNNFNLIKNKNFQNIDWDLVQVEKVEFVLFLGNYQNKKIGSLENHLGIRGGKSPYSVKKLLDNKLKNIINLDYIKKEEMIEFKVCKEEKTYQEYNFNLDINSYEIIKKEEFK